MSTFLQLCQKVERDSGTVAQGSRIDSVLTATNRQAKIVGWVADAWVAIQNARTDWRFMRRECVVTIIAGHPWYRPGDLEIDDFGEWTPESPGYEPFTILDPAKGWADESPLARVDWPDWRRSYGRGPTDPNRPHVYAIGPAGELCFGAVPDRTYTVSGEYLRAPQVLATDADLPAVPEKHHALIRHQALMYLADHDEAPAALQTAGRKYATAFLALVRDQVATGEMRACAPLV